MKDYLIECSYTYWCQGVEETRGQFLVRAESYQQACDILAKQKQACDFENLTLCQDGVDNG